VSTQFLDIKESRFATISSYDVVCLIEAFLNDPGVAEVFNIGGGKTNSISIIEAFEAISAISGKPMRYKYLDQPRAGDHICYYSDLRKIQRRFPNWKITKDLDQTIFEIHRAWVNRI
jgi:CDP-paratose 2-epimerase